MGAGRKRKKKLTANKHNIHTDGVGDVSKNTCSGEMT